MNVLVGTKASQGTRPNDFSWTNEGELLMFGFECDSESVDGRCGCRRALVGTVSSKATTTFKVADLPISADDVKATIGAALKKQGWFDGMDEAERESFVARDAEALLEVAATFRVGDVVEKRGDRFQSRAVKP